MKPMHSIHEQGISGETKAADSRLVIDAQQFDMHFDREPYLVCHQLCDHPLLALPRLAELARSLPEAQVEYNAGDLAIVQDPSLTPRNGLSITETVRRIADCRSWMVLKNVETDLAYRELLHDCLGEIRTLSHGRCQDMQLLEGFIFLTSPGSITPYHMDPEHNFLLQIQGSKSIHLFDGRDRSLVSEPELEDLACGTAHRNLTLRQQVPTPTWKFELPAGQGLYFPPAYPHYVCNGPAVSVSFSITFRTPDLERRYMVRQLNAKLRRVGWKPAPVGQNDRWDALKCILLRAGRRVQRWCGGTHRPSRGY